MTGSGNGQRRTFPPIVAALAVLCMVGGCSRSDPNRVQGYVEGEYVYVASPLPGALESLSVRRGAEVKAGDPLFVLESAAEQAARDEVERRLAQAKANLEDLKKGKRPSEIESLNAQLKQARVALVLAEREFGRQNNLIHIPGATAELDLDRTRSARDQNRHWVAQLEAELKTAQLGSRSDQITAAEANVRALEAALAKAEWDRSQKRQIAPLAGLVFETLYRQGEWVPAGRPVVALLPPQNIKVRAFVPQIQIGAIHLGDSVLVRVDGVTEPFTGTVSFISPQAEYTPPVIYSQESRDKLVFMIEALFDPNTAVNLHPGQPVDVTFGL